MAELVKEIYADYDELAVIVTPDADSVNSPPETPGEYADSALVFLPMQPYPMTANASNHVTAIHVQNFPASYEIWDDIYSLGKKKPPPIISSG